MEPHLPHDLVKHAHDIHIVPRTRLEVHASCPRGELFAELWGQDAVGCQVALVCTSVGEV